MTSYRHFGTAEFCLEHGSREVYVWDKDRGWVVFSFPLGFLEFLLKRAQ